MFNDINIGPITIHLYGLFIGLGFLSALVISSKRAKNRNLNDDIVTGIFYCAIVGGFLGCRILYYITEFPSILKDPSILWDFTKSIASALAVSRIFASHSKSV